MSVGTAALVFAICLAIILGASELLVRGLRRLGARFGLAAGLMGLVIAIGSDAPEIASAVVALLTGSRDLVCWPFTPSRARSWHSVDRTARR